MRTRLGFLLTLLLAIGGCGRAFDGEFCRTLVRCEEIREGLSQERCFDYIVATREAPTWDEDECVRRLTLATNDGSIGCSKFRSLDLCNLCPGRSLERVLNRSCDQ